MRESIKRLALAGTLALTGVVSTGVMASAADMAIKATPTASAEEGTTPLDFKPELFQSDLSGLDVNVTDDNFAITQAELQEYRQGKGEYVYIEGGYSYIEVDFFKDSVTPKKNIQIWEDGIKENTENVVKVGGESSKSDAWALYTYNYPDTPDQLIYYYVRIQADVKGDIDLLEAIESTDADFVDEMTAAQEGITVGTTGFLDGADAEKLGAAADDAGQQNPDQSTPSSRDRKNDDSTPEPRR